MALAPVGGGEVGTGAYRVLSQRPDLLVVGPSTVEDAVTVTAEDTLYGISFSFTRSTQSWEGGAVQAAASFYAANIQEVAGSPHVQGLSYTQGVNASGNLVDQMEVTVGTDDGTQQVSFVWPLETLNTSPMYARLDQVYNNLLTVAGLA